MFSKLGESFGTSTFHLEIFERVLGSKTGYVLGPPVLNPTSAYARLAWPTHPSRTS